MNRREFLAAAPMVFGLRELLAPLAAAACGRQDNVKPPAWFTSALARMKQTSRPGLILVAPADEKERRNFGEQLYALVESKDADVREVLLEAVVVCLTPQLAARLVPPAVREAAADGRVEGGEGTRVMLDSDGKRLAADSPGASAFEKPADFVASCRSLLHGPKGERLKDVVACVQKALPARDREEIAAALEAADVEERAGDDSLATLKTRADAIVPWLVQARLTAVFDAGRRRLRSVIEGVVPQGALPFGVSVPRFRSGCGGISECDEERDVAVKCGMAAAPEHSRKFVKILTE